VSLSGAVFVDRKNNKDAVKLMNQAGEDMKKNGISLWVFPEGTRSSTPEPNLLPFKKGAFHLAVQAAVPIIPVVCESYHRLFSGKDRRMERGRLRVRVLPPVSTEGLTSADVGKLAENIREDMLKALREISAPEELATAKPKINREISNDSTVPLASAIDGIPSGRDYGSTDSAETGSSVASGMAREPSKESELRRRVSQSDEDAQQAESSRKDEAPTGSTSSARRVGKLDSRDCTEDELDDEGAVLVKRP